MTPPNAHHLRAPVAVIVGTSFCETRRFPYFLNAYLK
jgi:hypothetical protein